ncbi:MAG TPA: cytochrome D1 domain-containing protein [Candidatus Acidoferrales bacterium]|nr:cytochrome D1 domain-containing protein [Candidatus Acidoferrales bacterium]
MRGYSGRLSLVWILVGLLLAALPLSAKTFRVYVTNHAGDTVDVIDPATNKVVQVIEGVEAPHDVSFSPDGSRVYLSIESENALDVVDRKSGKIIKKVALSGRPNTIAVTKDGRRVFVGIRSRPGVLDVIDTRALEKVKSIPDTGPLHDISLTPDGKYVVVGSEEIKTLTVVDVQTEQAVWSIKFDNIVRTMAFERNSDGSTRRIFLNTSFLHGFDVVDFAERKVTATIKLPDEGGGQSPPRGVFCHGIGVTPDNKTLWVNSTLADAVFAYSLPDLKLLGFVRTGIYPIWITFSPDGKTVYDSDRADNTVSVIDAKSMKEVTRIEVGQAPERNATLELP